jgi:hypothetical protein
MAILEGAVGAFKAEVDNQSKALRDVQYPRGLGYAISGITGTMAAALGANSAVFAMRLDPGAAVNAIIDRIRLQWTTIVAFTTPITAGRRLALFRGSGAATSGGTSIATAVPKDSNYATSEFNLANGGDIRIATTGALTVTGITFETDFMKVMTLTHVGAAGNYLERIFELHASESHPIILRPGQLLAVRNPVVMDAAGTWQLAVDVDVSEQPTTEYA